jgi:chemotaxis protein MotB
MMSFFLLLWLLNVTTDIQKRGIADYFDPTIASKSQSGAGGVLGGLSMGPPGAQDVSASPPSFQLAVAALRQPDEGEEGDLAGSSGQGDAGDKVGGATASNQTGGATANAKKPVEQMTEMELQKRIEQREEKQFAAAEFALRQAIQDVPELKNLSDNLIIDRTPEGLRIQIIDQEKRSMFPLGSAQMADSAQKLMALVALVVQKLPNKVSITGHTDAAPYAFGRNYTNWELSADRANASRRELVSDGVSADRIEKVVGLADRDPLAPEDPRAPRNRRISIVLLREAKLTIAAASEPPAP